MAFVCSTVKYSRTDSISSRFSWTRRFSYSCCRQPRCIFRVAGSIQTATSSPRICRKKCEGPHQVASNCTAPSTGVRLEWHRLAIDSVSSSTRCRALRMSCPYPSKFPTIPGQGPKVTVTPSSNPPQPGTTLTITGSSNSSVVITIRPRRPLLR